MILFFATAVFPFLLLSSCKKSCLIFSMRFQDLISNPFLPALFGALGWMSHSKEGPVYLLIYLLSILRWHFNQCMKSNWKFYNNISLNCKSSNLCELKCFCVFFFNIKLTLMWPINKKWSFPTTVPLWFLGLLGLLGANDVSLRKNDE